MRLMIGTALVVLTLAVSSPALAIDRYGQALGGGRAVASDPGAGLERLAAASMRSGVNHGRPSKSGRSILKDDPYLRAAFAWLDNK